MIVYGELEVELNLQNIIVEYFDVRERQKDFEKNSIFEVYMIILIFFRENFWGKSKYMKNKKI